MPKHYIAMNGSRGCLPDSNSVHNTAMDARGYLDDIFCGDLSEGECEQMHSNLIKYGIHYFSDPNETGADYCQVLACDCPNPNIHEDV